MLASSRKHAMKFEIEDFKNAKLASINIRSEKHGPEALNPAVDLTHTMDIPNTDLSMFDGHLLSALYYRSEAAAGDGGQGALEGMEAVSLPNLRFPFMGAISWGKEFTGYTYTIQHGLGGKSDIHLMDCKVNGFKLEPKEGGTVSVKFRVQCATNLNEKTMGKLALLAQNEVPIMLVAPEDKAQKDLVENPFPVGDAKEDKPKQQTPEEAFVKNTMPPL